MSIVAAQLIAEVKVAGATAARADLLGVGEAAGGAGGLMKGALLGAAIAAGTAVVGIGVASVKMAGDFQQAVLSLVAHAGLAKDQISNVSSAVLAMATEVGRSPTQLAEAMYPILSAFSGITDQSAKSKLALDTLKLSFQAVAGTTVDGTAVAQAAVGTFNALGLATNNAGTNATRMKGLFDQMDLTVQLGNMQWDQYKMVISKVAVAIQGTGVTFTEASAALATLTNEGMSARQAGTYLANMFTDIGIKTDAMAKHAAKAGVAFNEQAYSSMDLAHKIEYLNTVTDGNKQKLLALLGNNATALRAFDALSTGVGAYTSNLNSLNHAQGALATSFATASEGFNFQMSRMKAAGEALMITLGTALLPVLSKLMGQIMPLIQQFADWLTKSNVLQTSISGLSAWFTANLLPAFKELQADVLPLIRQFAAWAEQNHVLQTVITALGAVIMGYIAALKFIVPVYVQIYQAVGQFIMQIAERLQPQIQAFSTWWKDNWQGIALVLQGVWNVIAGVVQVAWAIVTGIIKIGLDILTGNWKQAWQDLLDMLQGMGKGIERIIGGLIQIIVGLFAGLVNQAAQWGINLINNILNGLKAAWTTVQDWFTGALNWIKGLFPHSPVEHGPLAGMENWGKNITDTLASGIRAGMPSVQSAFGSLVGPSASFGSGATSFAGGRSSLLPGLAATSFASSSAGSFDGTQTIQVFLDSQIIGQATGKYQAKQLRVQTGFRGVV